MNPRIVLRGNVWRLQIKVEGVEEARDQERT
jgi:hypothetical protein